MEKAIVNGKSLEYETYNKGSEWVIEIGGDKKTFVIERKGDSYIIADKKGSRFKIADIYNDGNYSIIWIEDREFSIKEASEEKATEPEESENNIKSTMPGVIKEIRCKEGQNVKKGDTLIVFESMKVLNELKSGVDGVVKKIYITEGAQVGPLELLVEIETKEKIK